MLFTITGLFSTWQPLMQSFYLALSMAGTCPNRGVLHELSPYFPTHSAKRNGAVYYVSSCFSVSANAFAASQSRAYNLNQRPAADVAAQIRDLYEEVNVTVVGQKIVARGEARLLDEIGQIIQQLDVATAQLRISVQSREDHRR
ncbi:MAG: hypothetical protein MH213_01930 [Marinobacter sp.]|nr:hypothetical protein [Marinobacter sp.]